MKKIKTVTGLFLILSLNVLAQTEEFKFKRTIENATETWHKIILPEASLAKMNPDFSDVRIFGNNGKIEAPFLLKTSEDHFSETEMPFKMINVSSRNSDYFYTFELSEYKQINQIKLDFEQKNFDWKIDLEASNNQSEWFSVLENYRILSIKNSQTDYQFTQVDFPDAKFRFYRLKIKASEQPKLMKARIWELKKNDGNFTNSTIKNEKNKVDAKAKSSIIYLELKHKVPISSVDIQVSNTFDYYRPITVEVLKDSVETESGWRFNYETVATETFSSLNKRGISLGNVFAKKLKITTENRNNQPLEIKNVVVKSAVYYLLVRFTEKADYSLFYGNPKAVSTSYDIENFQQSIPKNPTELQLQKEEVNGEFKVASQSPLFENKMWLWVLMGIIIAVIGYFSLKMLRE